MAYDRTGTGPWAWLKSVGTQEQPLGSDWRVDNRHLLTHVYFSKHPRSLRRRPARVLRDAPQGAAGHRRARGRRTGAQPWQPALQVDDGCPSGRRGRTGEAPTSPMRRSNLAAGSPGSRVHPPAPGDFQLARDLRLVAAATSLGDVDGRHLEGHRVHVAGAGPRNRDQARPSRRAPTAPQLETDPRIACAGTRATAERGASWPVAEHVAMLHAS